jgi:hypothetical protein
VVGYARLAEMLEDLFGLKISQGAIANILSRAAEPLAERAQTIHKTVRNSPVIASDETSARVKGMTFWQWTFRRLDVRGPPDRTDARQDRAGRFPRRREAQGVALLPLPLTVQLRGKFWWQGRACMQPPPPTNPGRLRRPT